MPPAKANSEKEEHPLAGRVLVATLKATAIKRRSA